MRRDAQLILRSEVKTKKKFKLVSGHAQTPLPVPLRFVRRYLYLRRASRKFWGFFQTEKTASERPDTVNIFLTVMLKKKYVFLTFARRS